MDFFPFTACQFGQYPILLPSPEALSAHIINILSVSLIRSAYILSAMIACLTTSAIRINYETLVVRHFLITQNKHKEIFGTVYAILTT